MSVPVTNQAKIYGASGTSDVPFAVDADGLQTVHVSSSLTEPIFVQVSGIVFSGTVTASIGPVDQGASGTDYWKVTGTVHLDNPFNGQVHETGTAAVSGVGVFQVLGTASISNQVAVSQTQLLSTDPAIGQLGLPVRTIFPIEHLSAFGELLTVTKTPLLGLNFNYSINSYFVTSTLANGGTVTQSASMAVLATTTDPSGSAVLESKGAVHYIAGTGMYSSFTAMFTSGVANSHQLAGHGDSSDGMFWGYSGTQFGVFERNNGVDTFVPTGSFNHDKLDGTGASGYTMDPTKLELLKTEFGWHGSGPIKFFLFDVAAGRWILAHVIGDAVSAPRFRNPTLPLHFEVANTGNTSSVVLRSASAAIYREAVAPHTDIPIDSMLGASGTSLSVAGTEVPVMSLQVTSSFNGQPNKVRVQVTNISLADSGGGGVTSDIKFRLNPTTLATASFQPTLSGTAVTAFDTSATVVAGGTEVFGTTVNGQNSTVEDLSSHGIVLNPGDILTVTSQHTAGGGSTLTGKLSWRALFSG